MPSPLTATYRLQFHAGFTFDDAVAVVPYLDALGVSHLYTSPILQATSGSVHGYDGTDPRWVNPELGGEKALGRLVETLHAYRMGLIVDIVPNHLAANAENPWWVETLALGREASAARMFDVAWDEGKIVLPVLGGTPATLLERGELQVTFEDSRFWWRYHDRAFPWSPQATRELVEAFAPEAVGALSRDGTSLPAAFDGIADDVNACGADRMTYLDAQNYELAFWRDGLQRVTYRRFFDIADLVCLRQEDDTVFDATHERILELAARGWIDGVRIDHVDGLADPEAYLRRLDQALSACGGPRDPYIVVEKILSGDETLPASWPVAGTTGYEFLQALNAVFVHPAGWTHIRRSYASLGEPGSLSALIYMKKIQVIDELFAAELDRVTRLFLRTAPVDEIADADAESARRFLRAVAASLPVYRTYAAGGRLSEREQGYLDAAIDGAHDREPEDARRYAAAFRAVYEEAGGSRDGASAAWVQRFEQFTGPVMAKGLEDTALYDWLPLASFNDVGAPHDPQPSPPEEYHAWVEQRGDAYRGMNTTSTHDTKRSEDARAFINLLSERAEAWEEALERWRGLNAGLAAEWEGERVPGPPLEGFLYQNLLAIWSSSPLDALADRMWTFAEKAVRERKRHGSWLDVDTEYEARLETFVRGMLEPNRSRPFIDDFDAFHSSLAPWGRMNAVAQTALKIVAPGVPDFYQGTEFVAPALVDPDNRRPVDFARRTQALATLDTGPPEGAFGWAALAEPETADAFKLGITAAGLRIRRACPELFARGRYEALPVAGVAADSLVACARHLGDEAVIVVVPRFACPHTDGRPAPGPDPYRSAELELPATGGLGARVWRDVLAGSSRAAAQHGHGLAPTGHRLDIGTALARSPIVFLQAE